MDPLSDGRVPKNLEVEKFACARNTEIEVLLDNTNTSKDKGKEKAAIAANPRHLRRRTNAYKTNTFKRRPNRKKAIQAELQATEGGEEPIQVKWENRRMRRRKTRLLAKMTKDEDLASAGAVRRLETHIWHAKRMQMVEMWGHMLAEGMFGRGHGSRSLCQKIEKHCVMHDASYVCPLLMTGTQPALQAVFKSVSGESLPGMESGEHSFWQGRVCLKTILYHPDRYPLACIAPCEIIISPGSMHNSDGEGTLRRYHAWLWVHPSAATEAYDALLQASHLVKASRNQDIMVKKMTSKMARLELYGNTADKAALKCLQLSQPPTDSAAPGSAPADVDGIKRRLEEDAQLWKAASSEGAIRLADQQVLHLRILDPRLAKPMDDAALASCVPPTSGEGFGVRPLLEVVTEDRSLPPALTEQQASSIRHQHRLNSRQMANQSQPQSLSMDSISCPIMAVRTIGKMEFPSWVIALPKGWAKPMWESLAFTGATHTGQREWAWALQHRDGSMFPQCYPDTAAAEELEMLRSAADASERSLRPKGKYPDPITTDWSWVGKEMCMGKRKLEVVERQTIDDILMDAIPGISHDVGMGQDYRIPPSLLPAGHFVARSRKMLKQHGQSGSAGVVTPVPGTTDEDTRMDVHTRQEDRGNDVDLVGSALPTGSPQTDALAFRTCYLTCTLLFEGRGTAERGAYIFGDIPCAQDDIQHELEDCEDEDLDHQPGTSKEPEDTNQLILEPENIGDEPQQIRGTKISGNILLGYVTAGEFRSCKGVIHGIAVLRRDMLQLFCSRPGARGGHDNYMVLVQNPRSTVSHTAKAVPVFADD